MFVENTLVMDDVVEADVVVVDMAIVDVIDDHIRFGMHHWSDFHELS